MISRHLTRLASLCTLVPIAPLWAQPIFNGKDLEGWSGTAGIWRVEEGAITASIEAGKRLGNNEFLYWRDEVEDFELNLEYRIQGPTTNSGIQYRSKRLGNGHAVGYQADLDGGKQWLGRIYDEHGRALIVERGTLTSIAPDGKRDALPFRDPKSLEPVPRRNDWNHYRIICRGHRTEIHINGVHFSTLEDRQIGEADLKGLIAFQLHSGSGPAKIQFRNVDLEVLAPARKPSPGGKEREDHTGVVPAGAPNIGFRNGDLSGWKTKGDAFEDQPVKTTAFAARNGTDGGAEGTHLIGGYEPRRSDAGKGSLTSDPFTVTHPWASLMVGGGSHNSTRVEIVEHASGKIIATFSGTNHEAMTRKTLSLENYRGRQIFVHLVDESSRGWGHINYDDFRFHHKEPKIQGLSALDSPLLRHLVPNPGQDDEKMRQVFVPEGFRVDPIAKEPEVRQPIAFTFDAKGRLWVAEAFSYPNRRKGNESRDTLKIFEDRDGNGTFESSKIFAGNLNLVSGFEIGYGGVFVGAAPELLFIPDRDGDDTPDGEPVVLLDGWDLKDTHETPNSFIWGHDGWLYGCHGVFNDSHVGKPGTPENQRIFVKAGIWRYHPVTQEFELYANGGSNQWGIDFSADGSMFMTHCRSSWGLGPVTQVFRDGHYWSQNNGNHREFIIAGAGGWNSVSQRFTSFLTSVAAYGHGEGGAGFKGSKRIFGGHSHVGTMIYYGDNWPEEYRGQLYTNNLHGSQINRELLAPHDSAYLSHSHGRDQLYSDDREYLAVDLKYGPDGAVYLIDWQDTQQCHVNDSKRWNRANGRINRMIWVEGYQPAQPFDMTRAQDSELLRFLSHDNEWYARMAQHLLRQRHAAGRVKGAIADQLWNLLNDKTDAAHRFRLLVALHAVGGLDDTRYTALLQAPDEAIRAQTFHFLTERPVAETGKFGPTFLKMAGEDPSARVRLALAGACQKRIKKEDARAILEQLALREEDEHDRFIPKMISYAYFPHALENPGRALQLAEQTPHPLLRDALHLFQLKQDPDSFMRWLAGTSSEQALANGMRALWLHFKEQEKPEGPQDWAKVQDRVAGSSSAEAKRFLSQLDTKFGQVLSPAEKKARLIAKGKANFAVCSACHMPGQDTLGPSLEEISKLYKDKGTLIAWIKKPEKKRDKYPQVMPPFDKMAPDTLDAIAEYLLHLGAQH